MKLNYKTFLLPFVLLAASGIQALAQDAATPAAAAPAAETNFYDSFLSNGLLLFTAFVIIGAFVVMFRLLNVLIKMQQIQIYKEQGFEAFQEAQARPMENFWNNMYKRWTKVVPVEKEEDILFDHNYDGIKELDNSLPPWWVAMFYITIAFAGIYLFYFHVSGVGKSSKEQYEVEVKKAEVAIAAFQAKQADKVDEENLVPLEKETDIAAGKTLFTTNCVACHGALGEGGVGPNMTDKFWIHGGSIKNIYQTIKNGVPEKGMIAWGNQLRPADMHRLASYILTLQGTNPPNGKAAEGTEFVPEAAATPQDTTAAPAEPAAPTGSGQ